MKLISVPSKLEFLYFLQSILIQFFSNKLFQLNLLIEELKIKIKLFDRIAELDLME